MQDLIKTVLKTLPVGSWCTQEKAMRMAETVQERRPKVCVEIGVFGGDTLVVVAQALRHNGEGVVYGIDPWSNADAVEGMTDGDGLQWWGKVDLEAKLREVKLKRRVLMLERHSELLHSRSDDPATLAMFANSSIDFFHLDGNHGKQQCLSDCRLWLSKLLPGCTIFVDDVGWVEGGEQTVACGLDYLLDNGCEIAEPMVDNCAILRKV